MRNRAGPARRRCGSARWNRIPRTPTRGATTRRRSTKRVISTARSSRDDRGIEAAATPAPELLLREALLRRKLGDADGALTAMRAAAVGGSPIAMSDLALLELHVGHLDDALAWGRRGAEAGPLRAQAHRAHGQVALAAHANAEALAAFERAYDLEPGIPRQSLQPRARADRPGRGAPRRVSRIPRGVSLRSFPRISGARGAREALISYPRRSAAMYDRPSGSSADVTGIVRPLLVARAARGGGARLRDARGRHGEPGARSRSARSRSAPPAARTRSRSPRARERRRPTVLEHRSLRARQLRAVHRSALPSGHRLDGDTGVRPSPPTGDAWDRARRGRRARSQLKQLTRTTTSSSSFNITGTGTGPALQTSRRACTALTFPRSTRVTTGAIATRSCITLTNAGDAGDALTISALSVRRPAPTTRSRLPARRCRSTLVARAATARLRSRLQFEPAAVRYAHRHVHTSRATPSAGAEHGDRALTGQRQRTP